MEERLKVLWDGNPAEIVGYIEPTDIGLIFNYTESWKKNGIPISRTLPLETDGQMYRPGDEHAALGFFAHLMFESSSITGLLDKDPTPYARVYKFLKHFGAECAGALVVIPDSPAYSPRDDAYDDVTTELPKILKRRRDERITLLAALRKSGIEINFSLAGVQDKIAVLWNEKEFKVPRKGSISPTDWILKPRHLEFSHVPENEYLCNGIARRMGLKVPESRLVWIEDEPILMVKRYDRFREGQERPKRLHQEDFCQATGRSLDEKYGWKGGPSLKECADLAEKIEPSEDGRLKFSEIAVFNLIMGNTDAHGKNFSILYAQDGKSSLAPFYDLLTTAIYPKEVSQRFAMRYGGAEKFDDLTAKDMRKISSDLGIEKKGLIRIMKKFTQKLPERANEMIGEIKIFNPTAKSVYGGFPRLLMDRCQKIEDLISKDGKGQRKTH